MKCENLLKMNYICERLIEDVCGDEKHLNVIKELRYQELCRECLHFPDFSNFPIFFFQRSQVDSLNAVHLSVRLVDSIDQLFN